MFEFTVLGKTATKGSTRSMISRKTGRIVTMADNKSLGGWTQAAKWAALQAGAKLTPKPGGVRLNVLFQFLPPASAKKRTVHSVKPDIDKMLRAVMDSLTGIAYEDDAQVIEAKVRKRYGTHDECVVQVFNDEDAHGLDANRHE